MGNHGASSGRGGAIAQTIAMRTETPTQAQQVRNTQARTNTSLGSGEKGGDALRSALLRSGTYGYRGDIQDRSNTTQAESVLKDNLAVGDTVGFSQRVYGQVGVFSTTNITRTGADQWRVTESTNNRRGTSTRTVNTRRVVFELEFATSRRDTADAPMWITRKK